MGMKGGYFKEEKVFTTEGKYSVPLYSLWNTKQNHGVSSLFKTA